MKSLIKSLLIKFLKPLYFPTELFSGKGTFYFEKGAPSSFSREYLALILSEAIDEHKRNIKWIYKFNSFFRLFIIPFYIVLMGVSIFKLKCITALIVAQATELDLLEKTANDSTSN